MNKDLMKAAGFGEEVQAVLLGLCPFCKEKVYKEDFEDPLSLSEYKISWLCQKCQDKTFDTPPRPPKPQVVIGPNDWAKTEMYQMKPAYDGTHTYRKLIGKSGLTWLVSTSPNGGDEVYVEGSPSDGYFKGFGGATLTFKLEDGTTIDLKGPWKSNTGALLADTGYDATATHLTFVVVAKSREYPWDAYRVVMRDVLYKDTEWTTGEFNRGDEIAQRIADETGEIVMLYSESQGGSSCGQVKPKK